MVTSQEIIENTFYISLLNETLERNLTINPEDYLDYNKTPPLPSLDGERRYKIDREAIGSKFISIFGIGNNQSRGAKEAPRITLELKSYYPGSIGLPKEDLDEYNENILDFSYETKDILIDVHLVASTQNEMRLLHDIMYKALPARGYIKPYIGKRLKDWKESESLKTGNLYVEVGNYYDHQDLSHGLLEKVYTYTVRDGLLPTIVKDVNISKINDISCLLKNHSSDEEIYLSSLI
jgi:hypothetical protein|nr:MAG TPA: hypothetical protein [Caudoviricetes sp.]